VVPAIGGTDSEFEFEIPPLSRATAILMISVRVSGSGGAPQTIGRTIRRGAAGPWIHQNWGGSPQGDRPNLFFMNELATLLRRPPSEQRSAHRRPPPVNAETTDLRPLKVVVVNPTYNEVDNVAELIDAVQKVASCSRHEIHQLIVDDSSPDGTANLVRGLQAEYKNLHLLSGSRVGLGAAYVRGFNFSMSRLDPDVLVEMDADLSHDPHALPAMLDLIERGYDLVVGSRYVEGASLPSGWTRFRKANSKMASLVVHHVAGLNHLRDPNTGFKAIRVKGVVDRVDWDRVRARGYSFNFVSNYHLLRFTNRVLEHPIQFADRKLGSSKIGLNMTYLRDVLEFLANACWIGFQRPRAATPPGPATPPAKTSAWGQSARG
jgi:hypothetical protein